MATTKTEVTRAEMKALGVGVRSLRKAAGLTVAEVAARSGLSRSNLTKLENGVGARSPGLSTIKRLAAAIGVRPSALLVALDHGPRVAHRAA